MQSYLSPAQPSSYAFSLKPPSDLCQECLPQLCLSSGKVDKYLNSFQTPETIAAVSVALFGRQMSLSVGDLNVAQQNETSVESDEIAIIFTLVTQNQDFNVPRLSYAFNIRQNDISFTTQKGPSSVNVASVVTLAVSKRALELPRDLEDALQDIETTVATAQTLPNMSAPVEYLSGYRVLASLWDVISPASCFELVSIPDEYNPRKMNFLMILFTQPRSGSANPQALFDVEPNSMTVPSTVPTFSWTDSNAFDSPHLPVHYRDQSSIAASLNPEVENLSVVYSHLTSNTGPLYLDSYAVQGGTSRVNESYQELTLPVYRARHIKEACEHFEIPVPLSAEGRRCRNQTLSIVTQNWNSTRDLLLALGFKEDGSEGGLIFQTYQWYNGQVESFESILRRLHWTRDEYTSDTSLYLWANSAVKEKVWDKALPQPEDQKAKKILWRAHRTWKRMVTFFGHTHFQYHGHPDNSPKNTKEYKVRALHQNSIRKYQELIQSRLINRP
ncbi:hypothetical protein F5878DRAFT_639698 [Lentinula raphanica]|uniref:Uncharacterized protein n=1 Tax=Lentinula raphanica TaxID=153919 RepID=A0AA38UHJ1_9AGAR|nr:hypothetical protein F5878DRAFT_639698 [Lentinula raphanica]